MHTFTSELQWLLCVLKQLAAAVHSCDVLEQEQEVTAYRAWVTAYTEIDGSGINA